MRVLSAVLIAIPVLLQAQGVATGGARPLSLEEAIRLAQRNAPSAVQARSQIQTSTATLRTARGTYLPTLTMNYNSNRQGGETFFQGALVPFRGDPWNFGYGMTSNLELFDGFRRSNQVAAARKNLASAMTNDSLQAFRIALDVKQQFFVVAAALELLNSSQAQLAQAQEQLNAASGRVRAGAAILSDSLRAVIQVGNARLQQLNAENTLRNANAALTRLVATPYLVTAAVTANEAVQVALDSAAVAQFLDRAPSVTAARYELEAAEATLRQSRSTYFPTLTTSISLNGSRTDNNYSIGGGPYANSYAARLTLSYPVFQGFGREENVARNRATVANATAALRDARAAVDQQFSQFVGALRLADARVGIQLSSVAAAEEDLRVQNQRYALGSSTSLDVLTSQATLNQARAALIQARYDARLAKAQIEALLGRDLP